MFIYVIVCNETLKLYVGQHKHDDLGKYLSRKFWDANHHTSGRKSHVYAAMRRHPRESWSIHPLVSGVRTLNELDDWEKHFIRVLKAQHPDVGYNICKGGQKGRNGPHFPETRQKLGELSRERWAHPEFRQRVSETQKHTPNAGRFRKGQKPSPLSGAKGPNATSFGFGHKPWNTGTRGVKKPNSGSFQKGNHMNRGRVFTEAHRRALSLAHLKKA